MLALGEVSAAGWRNVVLRSLRGKSAQISHGWVADDDAAIFVTASSSNNQDGILMEFTHEDSTVPENQYY